MSETINHTERAHSLLSPSGSKRWMTCTPSARLEESYEETSSSAAEEGTTAHELAEYALTEYLAGNYMPLLDNLPTPENIKSSPYYGPEMDKYVTDYVCYVCDLFEVKEGATMGLERKFDLSMYVPECSGSCDCDIVSEKVLDIIDLKYGKGVKVDAENNTQLMMYALGVLRSLPPKRQAEIETVRMHIAQVRLGSFLMFEMPARDLTHWAIHVLRPVAEKAFKGEGECVTGSHCKFCKHKPLCRAQKDALVSEFETHTDTNTLTLDEIGELLTKFDMFTSWLSAIKEHAMKSALEGKKVPGWKLVEGRSVRVISDEAKAIELLTGLGFAEDDLKNHKLKGIGDLEKMVGKKPLAATLKDVIKKPAGAPTLALEDDPREAIVPTLDLFEKI